MIKEKEYHLNPMSPREYAEMYLGTQSEQKIGYLTHLFEEYGKQFQSKDDEPNIDWKLIEKELKHLIQNWGVPENDYRGYPDAEEIVRTVKYIIEHKQN